MKTLIILAVLAFVAAEPNYYVLKKMDVHKMLNNIDVLQEFTDCLLEKIPCNKVQESYRVNTLEAVQQSCRRCTPRMKNVFWRYLEILKTKLPNDYIEFRQKYDPENKYFDAHEAELKKYSHL